MGPRLDGENPTDLGHKRDALADDGDQQSKSDDPGSADDANGSSGGDQSGGGDGSADKQPRAAAWGRPLMRLDGVWTRFEMMLCALVLALEIFALSAWIALKGMSSPPDSGSPAGIVFRALFGALVLGLVGYWSLKKQSMMVRRWGAIAGIALGFFLARYWAKVGVEYSSNLLNWYQQASSLTLLGGLRGVGTRLTLLLALLGGSLATAAGKHITIDLVTRFLKPKARVPVIIIGWFGASLICFTASWGFFDHVAIENFGAKADARPGQKVTRVADELGDQWFILRRQIGLDLKSTPHIVFRGEKYADWLAGDEWNAWIADSGIPEHYASKKATELLHARAEGDELATDKIASTVNQDAEKIKDAKDDDLRPRLEASFLKDYAETLKIEKTDKRAPILVVPGKGEPRGELVHAANLVFPIGLLIIALRFLLRSLLVISGHVAPEGDSGDEHADSNEEASGGDDGDGAEAPRDGPDSPAPGGGEPDATDGESETAAEEPEQPDTPDPAESGGVAYKGVQLSGDTVALGSEGADDQPKRGLSGTLVMGPDDAKGDADPEKTEDDEEKT